MGPPGSIHGSAGKGTSVMLCGALPGAMVVAEDVAVVGEDREETAAEPEDALDVALEEGRLEAGGLLALEDALDQAMVVIPPMSSCRWKSLAGAVLLSMDCLRSWLKGGGGPAEPATPKPQGGAVAPGGAKRLEFSEYVQGITSVWILHPVALALLGKCAGRDAALAGDAVPPVPTALILWQFGTCLASLWFWWDRRNSVAKWTDRTFASGCALVYMSRSCLIGGTTLAWSCILCALFMSSFAMGWFTPDWLWFHTFFRFFIFWQSFLTLSYDLQPQYVYYEWLIMALINTVGMFGHVFVEMAFADRKGSKFSLQATYPHGILRCGAVATACGSVAWALAL